MALKTYKLVATINQMADPDLPRVIEAIQKAARLMHADAMLLLGDNPPPDILIYGEDLVDDDPHKL